MANKTSNYNLTKPLPSEFYDIEVHNANMDIIDEQMKALDSKSATEKTTLVDADTIPLNDSAASSALKKITWANIKTVLGNVFAAKSHTHTKSQISDFPTSFTPSAHASSHKTGGSDAISPSDIGAVPTSRTVNGKALSANITLSAADVGLGNVPNVTTNNQTPTYSQASSLSNIASGEKLSTSMGKIMKAIADLISHLSNKSNPHGVTASQVGAVAKNEDIVIQKSGAAYDSIFGQGTRNALLRVRNVAGDASNQRTLAVFDSTQRPDLATAIRFYDVVDGTESIYSIFGEHNLDKLATALGAARVATGSYTGVSDSSSLSGNHEVSLSFDFEPKVLFVYARKSGSNLATPVFFIITKEYAELCDGTTNNNISQYYYSSSINNNTFNEYANLRYIAFSGNTVSWKGTSANHSLNYKNCTYYYIAIG